MSLLSKFKYLQSILGPLVSTPFTPIQVLSTIKGLSPQECREQIRNEAISLHSSHTEHIHHNLYPIIVGTSSIPNAGKGLFATSNIPIGTLLATYGGTYIPPIPTNTASHFDHFHPPSDTIIASEVMPTILTKLEGDYIICCENGGWIDGQHHNCNHNSNDHIRYDIAQLANHSIKPNSAIITLFDFPKELGVVKSLPLGSDWYYCHEQHEIICIPSLSNLKTMALVSVTEIKEGDEIVFDYDINPPHNQPSWYTALESASGGADRNDYLQKIISDAKQTNASH